MSSGPDGECAAGMLQVVRLPVRAGDRTRDRARALLILKRNAVGIAIQRDGVVGGHRAAVCDPHLDQEGIAAIHRGAACDCGVEVGFDLGAQSFEDQILSDGGDAVRRWAHDLRLLDRPVDAVGFVALHLRGAARWRHAGGFEDLVRDAPGDAGEVALEARPDVPRLRVAEHLHQHAQLDAIGVGSDLGRLWGQLLGDPRKDVLRAVLLFLWRHVGDLRMGIGEGDLSQVRVHRMLSTSIVALQLDLYARAVVAVPLDFLVDPHLGVVGARVHGELEEVRCLLLPDPRGDAHRLAGGEQAVHPRGADPDALLTSALTQTVELRAVEQSPEDLGHLAANDPRAVVLDDDSEATVVALGDLDANVGDDPRLLARIQRVVDSFLDRRQERLRRVVEAQEVPVSWRRTRRPRCRVADRRAPRRWPAWGPQTRWPPPRRTRPSPSSRTSWGSAWRPSSRSSCGW